MEQFIDTINEAIVHCKSLERSGLDADRLEILKRIREELENVCKAKTIHQVHYHLKFVRSKYTSSSWCPSLKANLSRDYKRLTGKVYSYMQRYIPTNDGSSWDNELIEENLGPDGGWKLVTHVEDEEVSVDSIRERFESPKYYDSRDFKRERDIDPVIVEALYDAIGKAKKECVKLTKGKLKTKASVFREILRKRHPRNFTGADAKAAYIEAAKKIDVPIRCNNIQEQIGYALRTHVMVKRKYDDHEEWCGMYGYPNNSSIMKWIPKKTIEKRESDRKKAMKELSEKRKQQNEEDRKALADLLRP